MQFGENAIADLAITDAKIANATISNAKIANIDAGQGDDGLPRGRPRIQAGTLTFDKLASTAVTDITDTIDLGGRNLLRNTGHPVTNASYLMATRHGRRVACCWRHTLSVKFTLALTEHLSGIRQIQPTNYRCRCANKKASMALRLKTFELSQLSAIRQADGYTPPLPFYQMPSGGSRHQQSNGSRSKKATRLPIGHRHRKISCPRVSAMRAW